MRRVMWVATRACNESESMIWDSNLIAIFLERPREKVDSNLFFLMIRFKIDSQINVDSRIFY